LTEDAVEVEVLDSGSRGLFGLGFRQARVRLTLKAPEVSAAPEALVGETTPPPMEAEFSTMDRVAEPAVAVSPSESVSPVRRFERDEALLQVSRETVEELLAKMSVRASVTANYVQAEDENDNPPVQVDVHGDDLSILIGPKAETLNALQYITNLIVAKEMGRAVQVIVDVEGYRARRAQQIRQLARRMAEQAVRTGRRQVLEPMPANERRLVHIELRNNPLVYTESIGDEPRRKVTIIPK
jgi:spoIIIJ-associated protein